jgi:hypothetical protein
LAKKNILEPRRGARVGLLCPKTAQNVILAMFRGQNIPEKYISGKFGASVINIYGLNDQYIFSKSVNCDVIMRDSQSENCNFHK